MDINKIPLIEQGTKCLITTSEWFYVNDDKGCQEVRAAYGPCRVVFDEDVLGHKSRGGHNWMIVIAEKLIIPGCQVQTIQVTDKPPLSIKAINLDDENEPMLPSTKLASKDK